VGSWRRPLELNGDDLRGEPPARHKAAVAKLLRRSHDGIQIARGSSGLGYREPTGARLQHCLQNKQAPDAALLIQFSRA